MRWTRWAIVGLVLLVAMFLVWPTLNSFFTIKPNGPSIPAGTSPDYLTSGNCNVAVIYLYYGVTPDPKLIPEVHNAMEIPQSSGYYSAQSFYQKYNVHMTFRYYQYEVTTTFGNRVYSGQGYPGLVIIANSWARSMQSTYQLIYSWCDLQFLFVQTSFDLGGGGGGPVTIRGAYGGTSNADFLNSHLAFTCAHEMGHGFGAVDHYIGGDGSGLNDAHCLMNHGGDGHDHLTTATIFGPVDLSAGFLHLAYVKKYSLVNVAT